jgi:hypothetical protein
MLILMSKSADKSRWDQHLERAAARSQAHRDRAKAIGRPTPGQVDRAIAEACHVTWAKNIKFIVGDNQDPDALRDATSAPINIWKIADRAVQILVERKRASKVEAGKMVMARLSPRPAFTVRVAKANPPMRARESV